MYQRRIDPQTAPIPSQPPRPFAKTSPEAAANRPVCNIVKVGGSVLTHKGRYKTFDPSGIDILAKLILCDRLIGGETIFIAGGGSYGNAAAHDEFDADSDDLSSIIAEWQSVLGSELARQGADAIVIASRELWHAGERLRFDPGPIKSAHRQGRTVVLLGDLLHRPPRQDRLLSSDMLPLFLRRHFDICRVGMISGASAVLDGSGLPIAQFPTHPSSRLENDGRSNSPDATGGMALKVSIMQRLAREGCSGWICGRNAAQNPMPILNGLPAGCTEFKREAKEDTSC